MPNNLSDRFLEAFSIAFTLHGNQLRKASQIPYIAHLLAVAALVLENGGIFMMRLKTREGLIHSIRSGTNSETM